MGIWELLDIEPTSDASTIKRAYAKKLKIYHPEDDPAGYQRLREAYDQALKYIKQAATVGEVTDNLQTHFARIDMDEKVSVAVKEHPVDVFLEKVEELYENFPARIELKNWEELLSSDVIWDIEHAAVIKDELIGFLTWHYHFPRLIWQAIDTTFHFTEQKEEMEEEYGEEISRFLLERIKGIRGMEYDIFEGNENIDYDAYFQLREDIQELLVANDLEAAELGLEKASQLCDRDPDILYMQAVYLTRSGNIEGALNAYKDMLSLQPENREILLARARLYYRERRYGEALMELEQVFAAEPEHLDALLLQMKCHTHLEQWDIAKEEVDELIKKVPGHPESQTYFYHTNYKVKGSFSHMVFNQASVIIYALFFFFLVLMRAWFYVLLVIITLITPASKIYTAMLLLLTLWEVIKQYRVYFRK